MMADDLSPAAREACLGSPEQFLAVQCLLSAASEARRTADLIEFSTETLFLRQVADDADKAAGMILTRITGPNDYIDVRAELTWRARI